MAGRKAATMVMEGILTKRIIVVKTSLTDTMAENIPNGDTIIEDTITMTGAIMGGAILGATPVGYSGSLSVAYSNQWGQVPKEVLVC